MSEGVPPPWADRYERVKRLGEGGQGTTLLVRSIATDESFALKELHEKQQRNPRRRKRMHIEAATLEVLDHPGIPRIVEHNGASFADLDIPLFMVMEYAPGGTLKRRIEKDGPLAIDSAIGVTMRLLETLAYCHAEEVVHRDVKPDNIAFRSTDLADPVLLDFGLTFNWRHVEVGATHSGEQLGNRFLHLPELLAGADRRDPRSDVTQCAGLLLYMLTGIEPVSLLDERGYAPHQRPDQHELLVGLAPPAVLRFFDQAFQSRLGDRFQTAESARMALADLGSTAERVSRAGAIAKRLRDRVFDDDL
jgi:serine/threonine protein kinase